MKHIPKHDTLVIPSILYIIGDEYLLSFLCCHKDNYVREPTVAPNNYDVKVSDTHYDYYKSCDFNCIDHK